MKTSSSENFRVAPLIPDHEMLRLIGKGSYGEVWLARSVTGAMRAVKVVQRSDFQYDKTFEREFEGIKKFEPISRSHPGLVDVLHVGRNLAEGFYYYVMELGDDQVRGAEIIPELYVARTLASDINQRDYGRLSVDECIDAGANLADALHYLHQRGLTHRDVKPSNVIFVEGVAKLADIGLVAASGQRTFVGTEGFVPPEGPGSPAADIYSLGMVLYEVSTGNDRLEFPELPSRLPDEEERPKWRALNAIVCKACAQKPKDRYLLAADFSQALSRVKAGRVRRKTLRGKVFRMALWAGLVATLILFTRHRDFFQAVRESRVMMASMEARDANSGVPLTVVPNGGGDTPNGGGGGTVEPPPIKPPDVPEGPKVGRVRIFSDPMVEVYTVEGEYVDRVGASGVKELPNIRIGPVRYILKREGYAPLTVEGVVEAGGTLQLDGLLKVFKPPVDGEGWENSFKMEFAWVDGAGHVARLPVPPEMYREFRKEMGATQAFMQGKVNFPDPELSAAVDAVMVTKQGGDEFCNWLSEKSRAAGYFTPQHSYVLNEFVEYVPGPMGEPEGEDEFEGEDLMLLMCAVVQSEVALAEFESIPPGAEIWRGDERLGTTADPLRIEPGLVVLTFKAPGFKSLDLELEMRAGQTLNQKFELQKSEAAVFGLRWNNHLGMAFVPMGGGLLFGAHEVTVANFRAFAAAEGRVLTAEFEKFNRQGEAHPVVYVSREDAEDFCTWLTELETAGGRLEGGAVYRLPMDLEWSQAAGLKPEGGATPAARDGQIKKEYPWGDQWPPPGKVANLKDAAIAGYDDGFNGKAPVGSFQPNDLGIYDLSGNAWEWVAEPYGGTTLKGYGVLRGGCFDNALPRELESSCRNPMRIDFRDVLYGFRVVIAKSVDSAEDSGE